MDVQHVTKHVARCLVEAGTTFRPDQIAFYEAAAARESDPNARWVLENIAADARVAAERKLPLCDDTGIPHVFVEFGSNAAITSDVDAAVREGIKLGLEQLPGRPMAVKGDPMERLAQSRGLYEESGALLPAPILYRPFEGKGLRITVLMQGGGPEIRGKTYRVFHKHDSRTVLSEVAQWAKDVSGALGCTPCVPAIGIGRTHYEASVLMLDAMKEGRLDRQSEAETFVTNIVNSSHVGPLGLGGDVTALGCFIQVGPQRASGVRIVCMRPGCCFDPRRATVELS